MTGTGLPIGAWPWLHEVGRVIGRYLYRPAFRITVTGLARVPRTGPVVLVANHSSLIEPQLIFGMLPRRPVFLVKEEMFRGFAGWALRRIGQVAVRRGEPDRAALTELVTVLRGGGLVAVFPEGSRGTGDVDTAQRGAAWLVRVTGATVLPVASRGTLPPADGRRRLRPRVDVLIGEPFTLDVGPGAAGLAGGTERLRGTLAELVSTLDRQREHIQGTGKEAT